LARRAVLAKWRKMTHCNQANDLGLEAENAVAFSPDLRPAQVRPSYAFCELFGLSSHIEALEAPLSA